MRSLFWNMFSKEQNDAVKFKMKDFSTFHDVYGYRGFFFTEINESIEGSLVVISSKDFTELVAYRNLSGECNSEELQQKAKSLAHEWLKRAKGFTEEQLEVLEKLEQDGII